MGRLNDAPEACHVTETLRVTCNGNFEGGTGKGVFFEPLAIGASSVAALTIGPLPNGYVHCRRPRPAMRRAGDQGALATRPWLGLGLAIGRTAHHLVSPKTGMSPAAGGHHLDVECTVIFAQSKGAHGPRSNRHRL